MERLLFGKQRINQMKDIHVIETFCVICHYSPKYDLYITLCCQSVRENIPATCRMEERKLVHAFSRITSRNTSFFEQQDKHRILLTLATSSTGFT